VEPPSGAILARCPWRATGRASWSSRDEEFTNSRPNPFAARLKRAVTIRLDEATLASFRELADETGIGYQTLINSYLKGCAATGRRPSVRWAKSRGAA
jgi:uncharacterized protein (DUF4415 family)